MNTPSSNTEPVICHAVPQETLIDYARKIFELAQNGKSIEAKFNKLEFIVTQEKFKSPEAIADYCLLKNQKEYEEHKKTPEYQERARQYKEQILLQKKQAIEEQEKLLRLSSDEHWEIVKWIEKNRNVTFYMDKQKIEKQFKKFLDCTAYKKPIQDEYQKYILENHHKKIFQFIVFYALESLNDFNVISFRIQSYINDWKTCQK